MKRQILKGNQVLNLVGRPLAEDQSAYDFRVLDKNLSEVGLLDFKDKIKLITSFPSLDTPVCDLQIKEFNQKANEFSSDIAVIGISKDLPFAQKRFCESFSLENIKLFSDYKYSSFGINYGLLIKELNLLARSVIIIDKTDVIRYIQIVKELSSPPNYNEVFDALSQIIKSPVSIIKQNIPKKCIPCEIGTPALLKPEVERLLSLCPGWQLVDDKKITKEFKFKDFIEAKYFLDILALIAEEQGHHPTFTLIYNKLKITLTTHASGGLTENDFIMAQIIDEINN